MTHYKGLLQRWLNFFLQKSNLLQIIPSVWKLKMTNTHNLSLLWITIWNIYNVHLQCITSTICSMQNTRGVSTNTSSISKDSIFPLTCQAMCSNTSDCFATSYDHTRDICVLHGKGTKCMELVADIGSRIWITMRLGRPCPKVRC